jgi:hypothetical protein
MNRTAIFAFVMAAACTAVWLAFSSGEGDRAPFPALPAKSSEPRIGKPAESLRTESAPAVFAPREGVGELDGLPWSAEALAREPQDQFAMPVRHAPYLHKNLNMSEGTHVGVHGKQFFYGVRFDLIVQGLPSTALTGQARARESELRQLIASQIEAATALEPEYWRQRFLDYHHAVREGEFVIVEHGEGDADPVRRDRIDKALHGLRLGRMNLDFVYIVSSSRTVDDRACDASAIIYLRRQRYPKSFELLDELRRTSEHAQTTIRERLGVTEPPVASIFPQ